ncbi:hypothetical protein DFR29_1089 [Tahibacter aquaticus]|uniref:Glutaconyl-CoA decarboxylase subunit gamma n=1 Tax=Tahibacter aquaticus TaxID=520092 RepID=A0A4V3DM16_9GAMM|nr:hypothetical protein [Tahibacter aquaticus]TDR42426.1 hypothetical protein DFR29_1089 [Tahibacter aquaticus]
MIRFARPLLIATAVLSLAACQKESEPAKPATTPAPATAPATPPPAAAPAATPPPAAAAPATADSVGVPECDNYITKYVACVSGKVPEASRAQLQASLDQMRAAWKQAAATTDGKASLAQACAAASDAAKTSMQAFGCTDF